MTRLKRSSKKEQSVDLNSLGDLVISNIIVHLDLDTKEQDFVKGELRWLFGAADNLLKICRGEIERSRPIAVPIPTEAQKLPQANNQFLDKPKDSIFEDTKDWHGNIKTRWQKNVEGSIKSMLKQIDAHLRSLRISLDSEATLGVAGQSNIRLQNQIRASRIGIVKILVDMAKLMNNAYGILITSPDQLIEIMEE